MRCYNCKFEQAVPFPLSALSPQQRASYARVDIILRQCPNCMFHQNHYQIDGSEILTPAAAAEAAPARLF